MGLRCRCDRPLGPTSFHGLFCRFARRTELNSVNIPSDLELSGLLRSDGKRPDVLTFCLWVKGRCLICDATFCDFYASSHILEVVVNEKISASVAEQEQTMKYRDLVVNYLFQSVEFETFRRTGSVTAKFLSTLVTCPIEVLGDAREGTCVSQRHWPCIRPCQRCQRVGRLQ